MDKEIERNGMEWKGRKWKKEWKEWNGRMEGRNGNGMEWNILKKWKEQPEKANDDKASLKASNKDGIRSRSKAITQEGEG